MKRFKIEYIGKTIDKFPRNPYVNFPGTMDAYEVIDWNGASRMVGTIEMCEEFVRSYIQR